MNIQSTVTELDHGEHTVRSSQTYRKIIWFSKNNMHGCSFKYRTKEEFVLTAQQLQTMRVLIVNDSNFMRKHLADLIQGEGTIIDFATDGQDALHRIAFKKPDVILLDLEMPKMDGLTFIENMTKSGDIIPTIVTSSFSKEGSKVVFDALENGAVDFLHIDNNNENLKEQLMTKIQVANKCDPLTLIQQKILSIRPKRKAVQSVGASERVVIIGSSTGGPMMVQNVLSKLPVNLNAGILLIQHMPAGFTKQFAARLDRTTGFKVKEAEEGDVIRDGQVLLAPGNYHMIVQPNQKIHLDSSEKRFGVRPSINMTMVSASEVYGANLIGVVLTGMGHDGAFGMKAIKKRGGHTIVQDKNSCVIYGMPKAVVELNAADVQLPIDEIPARIVEEVDKLV